MSEGMTRETLNPNGSSAKAWLRALELTTPIATQRDRILPTVIQEIAAKMGEAPALLSEQETLNYRELSERINQYARWALGQGLVKGEVVCLLMTNRPEYMAVWLGITSVGVVVSLLNTNLIGSSLAHCINVVSPKQIVVASDCIDVLNTALPHLERMPAILVHGIHHNVFPRIDLDVDKCERAPLSEVEQREVVIEDLALYIYTSGTTGLPKAARVSHARVMQWTHWFAGLMEVRRDDRMYDCLPMYHSVGGVQAPGAMLVACGSVVFRAKFSASAFWTDVVHWNCTMFQYIGELCRYLLHTDATEHEKEHQLRIACGNGLAPEVWDVFKDRFRIPKILEFYAATEGSVSLFNVEGRPGAIGRIPSYLAHRFSPALALFDVETDELARDEHGFCIRCGANQAGEALGKVSADSSSIGTRFDGYTTKEESEKRLLQNVFEAGDCWTRTGDLMRKDEGGFYYFVDRIGDTFRRKGENVATSEVSAAICSFPGIKHANVYGVAVPGLEGRVGMATLVAENGLDLAGFRTYLERCLPSYARPSFLRIRDRVDVTGTFKYAKAELVRQGYDPVATDDLLYFDQPESQAFVPLDKALFDRIQSGGIRV